MHQFLSFSEIFPNEEVIQLNNLSDYLSGINKNLLYKASIVYINSDNRKEVAITTINRLLNDELSDLKNDLKERIRILQDKNKKELFLLNIESSLQLFEIIHSIKNVKEIESTFNEIEIKILKAYLAINHHINTLHSNISNTIVGFEDKIEILLESIFTLSFGQSEFLNTNEINTTLSQFYKAKNAIEYIEKKAPDLLNAFLLNYKFKSKYDYLKHTVGLSISLFKHQASKHQIIQLKKDEFYENTIKLFNRFSLESDNEINDRDFGLLRNNPFLKDSEKDDEYWVIFKLFLIDKIFHSLYFDLKEINTNLENPKDSKQKKTIEDKFRRFYTSEISEDTILYTVLDYIFQEKKYYNIGGKKIKEEFNIEGEPDYYVRHNNTIYLFESKDILISHKIKRSYNHLEIIEKINAALYNDKKGIPQLVNNIEKILRNDSKYDFFKNINKIKIFPIIITHNRHLDIVGINNILNDYFDEELRNRGIANENIKPITLINIETFIVYQDYFRDKKNFDLELLLNLYHRKIFSKINNAKSEAELLNQIIQQRAPFNLFIYNKIIDIFGKQKPPRIIHQYFKDLFV